MDSSKQRSPSEWKLHDGFLVKINGRPYFVVGEATVSGFEDPLNINPIPSCTEAQRAPVDRMTYGSLADAARLNRDRVMSASRFSVWFLERRYSFFYWLTGKEWIYVQAELSSRNLREQFNTTLTRSGTPQAHSPSSSDTRDDG